ncbi:carbon-nitrogen hydrolase [Trichodelitschia bisporula]|uniref:Carbon-nitrogen hydrolase n=1 Tax=Trichodelitschia bisporula TaxID=703511 RepID=A0A6G1HQU2_9PEZI|nr:carbon-nitrogen hydrolase [Trichodelitschia bisporula]
MAPTYKIAIIQLYSEPLDVEANFEKAADFVTDAASQGAQLAVLPEYNLTSWVPSDPLFLASADRWAEFLSRFCNLARENNICIVPGTIIRRVKNAETGVSRLLNIAYFIDNHGQVIGEYVKKNLWHPERDHLHSSARDPHVVFDTPLGRVGMLVCWDLAFPEAFRELVSQGAKLIIIPSFWTLKDCGAEGRALNPLSEAVFLNNCLVARAFENTCAVVFVNSGGPAEEGFAGLSQVTVPFVGTLARLDNPDEDMTIVDVDFHTLELAEDNYKVRADLARDDWHYSYRHGR